MAEIGHALGLPGGLGELLGEQALRAITRRTAPRRSEPWRDMLGRIGMLQALNARDWIERLIAQGALTTSAGSEGRQ
jgi:hypothetical protein